MIKIRNFYDFQKTIYVVFEHCGCSSLVDKQRKGNSCPKGKYVCVINLTPLCHESLGIMKDTMCGNYRNLLSLEKIRENST